MMKSNIEKIEEVTARLDGVDVQFCNDVSPSRNCCGESSGRRFKLVGRSYIIPCNFHLRAFVGSSGWEEMK